jgi:hypothetical protein
MIRCLFGLPLLVAAVNGAALQAQEPLLPPCEPGYTYVCVTEYKQVEKYICKLENYTKKNKKWVYTTKDSPFCIHKDHARLLHHCDPPCCLGPFERKLLVKKEIIVKEEPATRCVTEKVVTTVPCTVWRKLPIDQALSPAAICPVPSERKGNQPAAPPSSPRTNPTAPPPGAVSYP